MTVGKWIEHERYWEWVGPQGNTSEEWLAITLFHFRASLSWKLAHESDLRDENIEKKINQKYILGLAQVKENEAMRNGVLYEDVARKRYIELTGFKVTQTGTLIWKKDPAYSYSPDGLVEDPVEENPLGLLEIKCVQFLGSNLEKDIILNSHLAQMQQGMKITGRKWCDYFVYCYTTKRSYLIRIDYDPLFWRQLHTDIERECKDIKPILLEKMILPKSLK